jgi:dTDP-4-dehydrorhamnose reductase
MMWLITGGSGQLGIAISNELEKRGLSFSAPGSFELDVTQNSNIEDSIRMFAPKIIVNCAAWTDVDGAEVEEVLAKKVNSDAVAFLALAAKASRAKLIHVSTDYVFSGDQQSPWHVDDLLDPKSAYGRTKADGERRLLSLYPEYSIIVRTAWLYSPWGKNFAKTMTRLALKTSDEIQVVNDQKGQPTSALDLAEQIIELGCSNSTSGIYHGTNAGEATWYEFAQEIFKLADADVTRLIPTSSSEYPRAAKRPSNSVLSHDAWTETQIDPMREWRHALAEVMPAIISAVDAGE